MISINVCVQSRVVMIKGRMRTPTPTSVLAINLAELTAELITSGKHFKFINIFNTILLIFYYKRRNQ